MTDREAVKQKIKQIVDSKKKNIMELAVDVCMHPTTLSRVLNDKPVHSNTVRRLYKAFCSDEKAAG